MSEKELSGRVALVTGAGRNIGRAMAKALAAGGAAIIVNVRSNKTEAEQVVREIERDGGKAIAAVFDVADEEATHDGVGQAAKQLGRLDYLVNNAAQFVNNANEPDPAPGVAIGNVVMSFNVTGPPQYPDQSQVPSVLTTLPNITTPLAHLFATRVWNFNLDVVGTEGDPTARAVAALEGCCFDSAASVTGKRRHGVPQN